MSTKTFCDHCGREIEGRGFSLELRAHSTRIRYGIPQHPHALCLETICDDCVKRIEDVLNNDSAAGRDIMRMAARPKTARTYYGEPLTPIECAIMDRLDSVEDKLKGHT